LTQKINYSRKIQKTGGSTYIIALPIEWIRQAKLEKGDSVEIFPQPDGNLLVQPIGEQKSRVGGEIEIDIQDYIDFNIIMRLILSKYLAGYQTIKIYDQDGIDFDARTQITQFVTNLMGVEIVEESDHWLILKDLSSLESLDLKQLIRRTHVLADKMFKSSMEAFLKFDKEKAELVKLQEPSVDRLYYLVSRQLNAVMSDFSYCSFLGLKLVEVLDYNMVIKRLEAIADHAYSTAQLTLELTEKIEEKSLLENIKKLSEQVRDRYNKAINCFFNNKILEANDIANEKVDFHEQVRSLYGPIISLESEQAVRIILLLRSFERISSYAADIAEVVINRDR
jgi:phosphate uptake regulator